MKRHAFDPISFVLGVVLIAAAAGGVWADQIDPDLGRYLIVFITWISFVKIRANRGVI